MTRGDITYQDKLNELRLDISHPNSIGITFILLEGESDIRLFRKLFNEKWCKVEKVPGGKNKLEDCVKELANIYPFLIGIRDADFIHLETEAYCKPSMFLTDYHDMEVSQIAEEGAFSALLFEFTDLKQEKHIEVRDRIIKCIEKISYLKWLNEIENLELKFDIGFQDLITSPNLELDFDQYIVRVLSKSPNARITDPIKFKSKIQDLINKSPNPFHLCKALLYESGC